MALEAEFPGVLARLGHLLQSEIDTMVDHLVDRNSLALDELLLRYPHNKPQMLFGYLVNENPNANAVCKIFMKQGVSPNGLNTIASLNLQ